jgi:NADH-quinone oxidoreductase subunit N
LAYYLRVVAAVWMHGPVESATGLVGPGAVRPAIAGGSVEADEEARASGRTPGAMVGLLRQPEVVLVAVVCAAATIAFGVYPEPLLDVARDAGNAITSLVS